VQERFVVDGEATQVLLEVVRWHRRISNRL